jgi:hypothetical protein
VSESHVSGFSSIEVGQAYLPTEKDTAKSSKGQIQMVVHFDWLGALCVLGG